MLKQESRRQNEQVSARLSAHEIKKIEELVAAGYCLNTSDFVRMAVREKLLGLAVAKARKPSTAEARNETISYLDQHDEAYASDIALDLGLDIELVFAVLTELKRSGEVV